MIKRLNFRTKIKEPHQMQGLTVLRTLQILYDLQDIVKKQNLRQRLTKRIIIKHRLMFLILFADRFLFTYTLMYLKFTFF